jgi:hypothetical protein
MFSVFVGRLLRFLPLIVIMVAVNLILDPGRNFRTWRPSSYEYERQIASLNTSGQNVAGVWSYDEREVQRYIAQSLREPPSVLVLGSSRMLQMHRPAWLASSFQNASVSGGSMLDLMALYHLYVQRPGPAPKVVLFGIDPWMLGDERGLDRYALADVYRTARRALGLHPAPPAATSRFGRTLDQLRVLVSPTYFQLALKYLAVTRGQRPSLRATTDTVAADPIRRSDGSTTYDAATRGRSQKAVDEEARAYAAADPIYNLGGFSRIDTEAAQELAALLRDATRRGSCAVVVLMPYHPTVYHALATSARYSVAISVGSFVRKLALSVGVPVVGDYDPAVAGLTAADFYDGMHVTEAVANRIASEAFQSCPSFVTRSGTSATRLPGAILRRASVAVTN